MITTTYYFQNCRDGFNHVGLLMNDGHVIATAKVHYINRTWENYNGQTARKKVCRKEINSMEKRAFEIAKEETNKQRRCPAVCEAARGILDGWGLYNEIKKHLNTL